MITQTKINKQNAYTLLEVLIAIFIFAILSFIATASLKNIIKSNQSLINIAIDNKKMIKAIRMIQDDLNHILKLSTTTTNRQYLSGDQTSIEFSHFSPVCVTHCPVIEKVTYQYRKPVLTRLSSATTRLNGVNFFKIEYLSNKKQTFSTWPPKTDDEQTLHAIRIHINDVSFYITL